MRFRQHKRAALILFMILATAQLATAQLAVKRSTVDARYFAFRRDPEVLIGAAADMRDLFLRAKPRQRETTTVQRARELRPNAASLKLETYVEELPMTERGNYAASASEFWRRVRNFVGEGGPFDLAAELRISAGTLREFGWPTSGLWHEKLVSALESALHNASAPLVTIDGDVAPEDARVFRDALHARRLNWLVGMTLGRSSTEHDLSGFDYVVVPQNVVAWPYSDQALIGRIRALAGDVPIILRQTSPELWPELFWLTTGAAAVFYEPMDETVLRDKPEVFSSLRAVSSLMRAAGYSPPTMIPTMGRSVEAGWRGGGTLGFYLLQAGCKQAIVRVPMHTNDEVNLHAFWYDVGTDVHLILPPLPRYRGQELELTPPSRDRRWIYGAWLVPASADRQTTYGPIVPLDGEE
ncbi:hypothetical protein BRCON_1219 [Candidatus Sumerlaea chitinivorans]|uniref:Uncharacterized protein n=1 Tax=Sumerlaea chitinivorans TaxID=2250252 RepID=A0A2Z4Y4V4_SUMC1|nr:hypothetical protein BRCON_1219 [Candidatus Sumerlaea chitinivorans]